eukprot:1190820-Prorocentrum_minimum.AAC.2
MGSRLGSRLDENVHRERARSRSGVPKLTFQGNKKIILPTVGLHVMDAGSEIKACERFYTTVSWKSRCSARPFGGGVKVYRLSFSRTIPEKWRPHRCDVRLALQQPSSPLIIK